MDHLYVLSNGYIMAADYADQATNHVPAECLRGATVECRACEGTGDDECDTCGHVRDCEACDGVGSFDAEPGDDIWEQLHDLKDVTILDEFGAQVTKPAYQWASEHKVPTLVGELYHYAG